MEKGESGGLYIPGSGIRGTLTGPVFGDRALQYVLIVRFRVHSNNEVKRFLPSSCDSAKTGQDPADDRKDKTLRSRRRMTMPGRITILCSALFQYLKLYTAGQ